MYDIVWCLTDADIPSLGSAKAAREAEISQLEERGTTKAAFLQGLVHTLSSSAQQIRAETKAFDEKAVEAATAQAKSELGL